MPEANSSLYLEEAEYGVEIDNYILEVDDMEWDEAAELEREKNKAKYEALLASLEKSLRLLADIAHGDVYLKGVTGSVLLQELRFIAEMTAKGCDCPMMKRKFEDIECSLQEAESEIDVYLYG